MEPYEFCSRYETCSVNACPLDPLMEEREGLPDDPEPSCPMAKGDRERTWARLPSALQALLPYHGLTRVEWGQRESGRRLSASLTPEQREENRLRFQSIARLGRSGKSPPPGRLPGPSNPS